MTRTKRATTGHRRTDKADAVAIVAAMVDLDILTARSIALDKRCDPRTVMREWRYPGSVRGLLGELLRPVLADLRNARSPATPELGTFDSKIAARG